MVGRSRLWSLSMGVLVTLLSGGIASGQNVPEGDTWQVPRTPDGRPDLQGVWTNETITPFERGTNFAYSGVSVPESAADKAVFTEEEAARFATLTAEDREANFGYTNRSLDAGTQLLSTRQTSLVVHPPTGRVPVKAWAEAERDDNRARERDDYRHMSVWDRCMTRGIPGSMFPAGYNNAYRIIQMPDAVVIFYEMIHDVRVIPIGDRPRLNDRVRQWMGDARGHWEGDTLVVTTTNFNDRGMIASSGGGGRIKGVPVSEALHVVERFTRTSAGEILWKVTVEDPDVYEGPWTVSMPLTRNLDYVMFEYACHEGNRDVPLLLEGRVAEESFVTQRRLVDPKNTRRRRVLPAERVNVLPGAAGIFPR